MKYTEGSIGRVFILRLEDGDRIPECIEQFADMKKIKAAAVYFLGGTRKESQVFVGPEENIDNGIKAKQYNENTDITIHPMVTKLTGTSEAVGLGTLFLDEESKPKLHLHSSFGREQKTITGCTRKGIFIWQIGEVIILEIKGTSAGRKIDSKTGFELLSLDD
ncbi:MAG: PPC domain-containing DNA-binding protein [Halothermotrichaceae bacterium]